MITLRKAQDRGHANHGWLDSWHSFSFAGYQDNNHVHFGPLRVINEDRVAAGQGFGSHPHRDMEIISYVLEGELEHKDNMGNGSIIKPGNVQRMSAGTGVVHSEYNPSAVNPAHFLQIWIIPNKAAPASYEEKTFPEEDKRGKFRLVASGTGENGSVTINQDAKLYIGLFDGAETTTLKVNPERLVYVHVARGTVTVNGQKLEAGDAAKIRAESAVTVGEGNGAEVLVFDLPQLQ
ncbi:pirin family protein [Silvimonas amylolytica]|uniref:Pirin family protein n=1 Tax=Silvimonas amylolytica TaxID=449663 RepID=A0ABQ2PMP1_9NEIS|nr:pirin family protein [Silvimonas amylolytica]GGP26287.1 pirin family protein [Silvimonas amylolytica]